MENLGSKLKNKNRQSSIGYHLVTLLVIVNYATSQISLTSVDVSECDVDTQYFDSTYLGCVDCPTDLNLVPNANQTACQCALGYYKQADTIYDFLPTCVQCEAGTVPSQDQTTCLPCDGENGGSGLATLLDTDEYYDCLCPSDYKIVEFDSDGNYLDAKTCQLCPDGEYQGPNDRPIYECTACSLG